MNEHIEALYWLANGFVAAAGLTAVALVGYAWYRLFRWALRS
jgi:hypothetical protein